MAIRLARPGYSRLFAATTAALALLVSGCAAGQIAQTAQQVPAIDGANADAQGIGIRDVLFATPKTESYSAGASAPLKFWVSNSTLATERLSNVSSPVAATAQITGNPDIPAQSLVEFGPAAKISVTLTGLKEELVYGRSVPVTFTFASAGTLTVKVPIEIPGGRGTRPRETVNVLPPEHGNIWFGEEHEGESGHDSTTHAESGTAHVTGGSETSVSSHATTSESVSTGGAGTTAAH